MREIKFRGQRVDTKEWVYGDLIHGVGPKHGNVYILPVVFNLAYLPGCHPLDGYRVIPESVGQFTGKKDKEGVDVYEGDILDFDAKEWGKKGCVGEVTYDIEEAAFSFGCGLPYDLAEWRKIIGNIHTTPNF